MSERLWIEGVTSYPIYYEDTDFSGYVYHANYLKYFDRAREDLIGLPYLQTLFQRGLHFVVARVTLSYLQPARHGDTLHVTTRMSFMNSPVSTAEQAALRISAEGAEEKIATATIKVAAVDAQGRLTDVPDDVLAYLRQKIRCPTRP